MVLKRNAHIVNEGMRCSIEFSKHKNVHKASILMVNREIVSAMREVSYISEIFGKLRNIMGIRNICADGGYLAEKFEALRAENLRLNRSIIL